jgi:hypothetical protein
VKLVRDGGVAKAVGWMEGYSRSHWDLEVLCQEGIGADWNRKPSLFAKFRGVKSIELVENKIL